ncbi:LysR family transcriptional regulator ArgP [Corynebacterium felinum]|uniref:LysR family transcriptional regulator (Chromosome initiation inhibitor) n=1 Tax=Corynebacterium felinum TaxID=131318 RepID=A0ABU2B9U4_9CORY|nr:LysR family transcriptional regulator ArgP [Corynebacterium felinum]MDF5821810.1 LysR family transcriptional regulator ArgP [Corynebacterium felinum]MDR7355381.1 LysR family transcriptional regulator (chromosome initiation inhibitor) [Corynebacterium felinum]WJY94733.1 putative HTH-type transcriptional regulator [Corynebacterium felinum]
MNPIRLHTLLTIVDEGSFEIAAAVLGISPSAVSQRIKALEKEAGRVLLRRSTPVTATPAGEVLVQAARQMALLEAETLAALRGRIAKVPLSVVVNADSLATWFKPVLADVASWDQATLQLRIEDESHSLNLLRRGDALGAVTKEKTPVSGCDSIELGSMRYVSVSNPWLLDRYTNNGVVDWEKMPALRFGPRDQLQTTDLRGRVEQLPNTRRISQIPSAEAFVEATRVGLGWSLLPIQDAKPLLEAGEIVLLDDRVLEVPLYWQRWRLESPSLERLTESVQQAAANMYSNI